MFIKLFCHNFFGLRLEYLFERSLKLLLHIPKRIAPFKCWSSFYYFLRLLASFLHARQILTCGRLSRKKTVVSHLKKDVILVLLYLGLQSDAITRRLKSCVIKFYGFVNIRVVFQNTSRILKSFFPYKDRFNRSQKSKIVYKAGCWDCDAFYIGKTKRRLHDRKTEHFKALTQIGHASAVAEHSISTGHNIKWDHFEILASGQCDLQCKMKETLLIRDLKPALNENVGSENILLY